MSIFSSRLRFKEQHRLARKSRQHGAIGLLGILVLLLAIMFATLSVDAARLWMERHNLQKAADMSALASARFTGCGNTYDDANKAATDSATDNGFDLTDKNVKMTFQRGQIVSGSKALAVFTAISDASDDTNGTQVTLTKTVPASLLMGGLFNQNLTLTATATARGSPPIGTFTLGASTFSIDNDVTKALNSMFSKALNLNNVNVNASVFQQLNSASISLQDLVEAGKFTSVEDMLSSDKTVLELLQMWAESGSNSDNKKAMSALLLAVGPKGVNLKLKDVLSLNSGNRDALLSAQINILNLVTTSISIAGAQKSHLLDFNVGAADTTGIRIQVGDIPPIAVGAGGQNINKGWCTATSSSNTILTAFVSPTTSKITGPILKLIRLFTLGVVDFDMDIAVQLKFGNASAHLKALEPNPGTAKAHLGVTTSAMAIVYTNYDDAMSEKEPPGPGKLIIKIIGIPVGVEIGSPPPPKQKDTLVDLEIKTPIHDPGLTHLPQGTHGSSELAGTAVTLITSAPPAIKIVIGKLGFDISKLTTIITSAVSSILEPVLSLTIDPVLRTLGINIGSADVTLYDMQIVEPQLVY